MRIGLNDFSRQWQSIGSEAIEAMRRVGASGSYILGSEVEAFEAALAEAWPAEHAVATGNGLDAIEIGLRCLGLGRGDRVLTTPLSAFATTLAVLRIGAVPVFVDVDDTGLLDLERCHRRLAAQPRIDALLPVHLYGQAIDQEALEGLAETFDVQLLEDAAQSILAEANGRRTGTAGIAAATSFYPTKNLGALGDGGALLTDDEAIAERARLLRHYGQTRGGVHEHVGLNSRLDEMQAALLRSVMLPRLPEWTERRRATAARYLSGIHNPKLGMLRVAAGSNPCWHLFPVLAPPAERDAFVSFLASRGIQAGIHYPRIIPQQPAMAAYGLIEIDGELDNARRFARSEVSLPVHPFLVEGEVGAVISACNEWSG